MTVAYIFPGQGSQRVGMGKALSDSFSSARRVFEEVDDAVGESLSRIMWEGPEEELTLTANAQPALMAVSLAVVRVLADEGVDLSAHANCVAGHSLGEYSALAAAGALSLADAARLLRFRGEAMQRAVPPGVGGMAALLGLDHAAAQEVALRAAQGEVCQVANDNAPGQVVISGDATAVARAVDIAVLCGARRTVLLPVSAPFHCSLMAPAAEEMADMLSRTRICPPSVPLICNVLARPVDDPSEIRKFLVEQVSGMVRWRESVVFMVGMGVESFYELGVGRVLSGLTKQICRDVRTMSTGTPEQIAAMVKVVENEGDISIS